MASRGKRTFAEELADAKRQVTAAPPDLNIGLITFMRALFLASTDMERYEAAMGIARCHFQMHRFYKAIEYCNVALQQRPEDSQATLLRGQAEQGLGDLKTARASLVKAQRGFAEPQKQSAVTEALEQLTVDEWQQHGVSVLKSPSGPEFSTTRFPITAAVLTAHSLLCDLCLKQACECALSERAAVLREKERSIDFSALATRTGLDVVTLRLCVRSLVLGVQGSAVADPVLPLDKLESIAQTLCVSSTDVAQTLAFVKAGHFQVSESVHVVSQELASAAKHSCYPTAFFLAVDKDGSLAALSESGASELTVNFVCEDEFVALPRRRRHQALRQRRAKHQCDCDRCQDERDDQQIEAALCRNCSTGFSFNLANDEWTCKTCGTLSIRPTEWTLHWETVLERSREQEPVTGRAKLTEIITDIEAKLAPFHWLRFQVLYRLVHLHMETESGDKSLAAWYARKLLFLMDSGVFAYSRLFRIRNFLLVDVVAPSGYKQALLTHPGDFRLRLCIEEALLPLLVLLDFVMPPESASWRQVKQLLARHATGLLRMAAAMEGTVFSSRVSKQVIVKRVCVLGLDERVDELLLFLRSNEEVLHQSVNHMCIDSNTSILAVLAAARKSRSLRSILALYQGDAALADESGFSALFAAAKAGASEGETLEAQVAQSTCLKLLLKDTSREQVRDARLVAELGGGSLLHQVSSARIARLLINAGASLETLDAKRRTPVVKAYEDGNVELAEFLTNQIS